MNQDDKEARMQEIGEFPNNDHGPTTPPPHLGTITLQLATILERLQPLHPRDLDLPAFDEALTEGLPTGDQRLVRVVTPKSLSEWYELTSRVRGNFSPQPPRGPDNPPRMEGPYHNTPRPPPRAQNYAAIPPSPCKFCQGQHWHSQCQQRPTSNAQHCQTYHASHHRQGTFNQANNGLQTTPSTAPAAPTTSNTSPKQLFHWGKTQGLTFNPSKTQACLFHWKAKRPGYHGIHFQNQPILIDNTIKILGVTFDSKRNFVGHLDNILKRCRWILPRLTSTIQGQFGLTFSAGRKIHNMVILPAILCGSGVWGKRVFDTNGIRKLRGLHYKYAKALIRGGPCTPTIPAISLTGCPPLDISIKSHLAYLEALREGPFESRPSPSSVPYPPLRRPLQFSKSLPERATIVYTDGSRSTNGVGAAVVLPPPYSPLKLKLHNSCTSFQAELLAILYATRSIRIMPRQDFVIASDCQAALHAICHPDIPRTPLTAEIIRNLNTLDNVQLCWVRSHCGIIGNEQADEVAKAAAQSKLPLHFATLPRKYVRSQSKQFALQLWTDLYTTDHATRNLRRVAASPSLLISILPKLKYCNVTSTILTGHGFVQADIARTSKNNDPMWHRVQSRRNSFKKKRTRESPSDLTSRSKKTPRMEVVSQHNENDVSMNEVTEVPQKTSAATPPQVNEENIDEDGLWTTVTHAKKPRIPPVIAENAKNISDFKKIREYVQKNNGGYSYRLQEEKPLKVVLKGVTKAYKTEDIAIELATMCFTETYVKRLHRQSTKRPMNIVMVELPKNEQNKKIYGITELLYQKIAVESFRTTNRVTQCFNCQGFGHGQLNCFLKPKCVKCSEDHHSKDCQRKSRQLPPKCANCEEAHTANYRRCPKFPKVHQQQPRYPGQYKPNNPLPISKRPETLPKIVEQQNKSNAEVATRKTSHSDTKDLCEKLMQ
ncbi:hypothetical protein LAZ67_12003258, partial [Cordylochernes scorpioides]